MGAAESETAASSEFCAEGTGRIEYFMDLPISWVPTTWVFRDGKLRYAINYGEVRFPVLQQMIADKASAWNH